MIKAIMFDIGGVFLNHDFRPYVAYLNSRSNIKKKLTIKNLVKEHWMFDKGDVGPKAFCSLLSKKINAEVPFNEFKQVWNNIFTPKSGTFEIYQQVRDNYETLLLSNINPVHANYIFCKYPTLKNFEHKVLSYKIKMRKPEAEIYEYALNELGIKPKNTVFIDDKLRNVKAARALGINAIKFNSPRQLRRELLGLGVKL